jgi:hypothetical protein
VICIDAAVHALAPRGNPKGDWILHPLEAINAHVSEELLGYLSPGSKERETWETRMMADPRVAAFTQDTEKLIAQLEASADSPPLQELRAEARSKALSATEYFAD